jgi:hypothetical protein
MSLLFTRQKNDPDRNCQSRKSMEIEAVFYHYLGSYNRSLTQTANRGWLAWLLCSVVNLSRNVRASVNGIMVVV